MSRHKASATVFGNVEIELQFTIQGAEPDVGIMTEYIEEWWVTHINGVSISNPKSRDKFCEAVEADPIAMELVNNAMYGVYAESSTVYDYPEDRS